MHLNDNGQIQRLISLPPPAC
ncbi:hypothetical protein BOSE62_70405 [Bosea sp. 62]|nr:hypothetical protein BOSE7B_50240 [Bosea sp. 7B]CAD5300215.1 hypothetical protein BOSE21B_91257 [Bosea sp. 21B]VVT61917.1 hypothetical protein BOS5A_231185 [Bosea sp. EC-HK365B]VXB46259.1 hypothetical protein BOSE125_130844 [Bosea sp. 125]VXC75064.1 hypothetical protein BOSE62_70405 [Bosea sp. 62]VXC98794.1 hypothetical protein BOSE127_90241 [Bosea sp. 127]